MAKLIFRDFAIICGKIMEEYQSKSNETLKVCLVSSSSAFFYDTLKITNDELEDNEGCDIINWGGVYEIRAKKQASTPPPIAIVQKTATKNGKDYILTCYKDSTIKFLLESASDHLPIAPFVEILTPEIIMQDSGNSVLFVAKAACQDGTYLLMLSAFPEMKILFEDSGSSVNYNNNEISITKTIDDMLMREKTSIYHYENGCSILKSNMFKYTNEHIYIDELKPYLLLEAVMAEDIE
ncbi:MAG: hypothetical protein EOM87_02645, partial [Clostridia bacterium]|nr:hypothetical protein [Clostridia bacterium]